MIRFQFLCRLPVSWHTHVQPVCRSIPEGLIPFSPESTLGPYFQIPLDGLPSALDPIPGIEGGDYLDVALNSVLFFPRLKPWWRSHSPRVNSIAILNDL
ncbi:hypothetical protein J0895_15310 [Phormidium pseudopriestleyi FRX01]|uniref:Uncharacterized protein n=1 Tax=Phormidium pseudopriestleyi FRX01 TaxID=1759528 RepID=A0ABS3FTX0_9CYAN|nr:hypothetical protein [Phormidium pseudopriestleyi]MBO0350439.1 hypothetical protein [Phormidium pseudopriestleyi FRX01]